MMINKTKHLTNQQWSMLHFYYMSDRPITIWLLLNVSSQLQVTILFDFSMMFGQD